MQVKYIALSLAIVISLAIFFVVIGQKQIVTVPYLTPASLQVDGMKDKYRPGENVQFAVTVNGYGSNCHMLQVETTLNGNRTSFYKKADDCRFIPITHSQYNLTRSFDYGSKTIGKEGTYTVNIQFKDLVDNREAQLTKTFEVQR